MKIIDVKNTQIGIVEENEFINTLNDAIDLMGNASYSGCCGIIISKENLNEDFFDLKTRLAGDILQKFANYRMKIAIVGDFSIYSSNALKNFIYESNNGNSVFFVSRIEDAKDRLQK